MLCVWVWMCVCVCLYVNIYYVYMCVCVWRSSRIISWQIFTKFCMNIMPLQDKSTPYTVTWYYEFANRAPIYICLLVLPSVSLYIITPQPLNKSSLKHWGIVHFSSAFTFGYSRTVYMKFWVFTCIFECNFRAQFNQLPIAEKASNAFVMHWKWICYNFTL
jgi:hypothetical protein